MTCSAQRAGEITDSIVNFVALDLRPVSVVNGGGFRRLLPMPEPGYRVPSHTHIASLLRQKHTDERARLKNFLASIPAVTLTTDMWTSKAMEDYITATVHFVTADWRMSSFVLTTAGFAQHPTTANIGSRLVEIAEETGVVGKVSAVVHDEAANQVAALRKAANGVSEKNIDASWKSIICVAHRSQTCLKYGFGQPGVARMLATARKLVGHFRHSAKATHTLEVHQERATGPASLSARRATAGRTTASPATVARPPAAPAGSSSGSPAEGKSHKTEEDHSRRANTLELIILHAPKAARIANAGISGVE